LLTTISAYDDDDDDDDTYTYTEYFLLFVFEHHTL